MFENLINLFKKFNKKEEKIVINSKEAAKERLHLVLMQDRANVSADFLELMKQEIIEVIKKYIDVDENAIDVRLTNKENADGTNGAPALYANIPILNIKNEARKVDLKESEDNKKENEDKVNKTEEKTEQDKKEKAKNNEKKEKIEDDEVTINKKIDKSESNKENDIKENSSEEKHKNNNKDKIKNKAKDKIKSKK